LPTPLAVEMVMVVPASRPFDHTPTHRSSNQNQQKQSKNRTHH
jgi:hypothetical protein